jgi:hypothetical protein
MLQNYDVVLADYPGCKMIVFRFTGTCLLSRDAALSSAYSHEMQRLPALTAFCHSRDLRTLSRSTARKFPRRMSAACTRTKSAS